MAAPASDADRPEASIVVCTLNRGHKIDETIESLLAQQDPGGGFEILLVDNASSDDNARILRDHAERRPDRIRYVRESEVGESAARNCGTLHARGDIHAHIDDDAVADPGWIRAICAPFREDPKVGGVGGAIDLRFETDPPAWVDASLWPFLSAFDEGERAHDLHYPDYPRGANMAFRAAVFEATGPFSTRYGRKGRSLLSYCETEMYYRVEQAGYRVCYAPAARIDHIVSPGRLTEAWFRERIHWQGRSMARFEREHFGLTALVRQFPRQFAKWVARPRLHRSRHAGWMVGAVASMFGR